MTAHLVLLGAGAALGLMLVVIGASRRQAGAVGQPEGPERPSGLPAQASPRWQRPVVRLGGALDGLLPLSLSAGRTRAQDLEAAARTTERHLLTLGLAALIGLLAPVLLAAGGRLLGLQVPPASVLPLGLAGGVMATIGVRVELRRAAGRARDGFRRGLSCWLDLVALAQAGGMGVEGALVAASGIATDPTFDRIRQALDRSRRSGTTPWLELGRLGGRIGIDELEELAASLALAGAEGARVRASLQAKSASLRRRLIAEAQSRANATTERLFLPSIVLMIGFLVFVMYPAGVSLSHVL